MEAYRKQLDVLDAKLMALFEARMQVVRQVGVYKQLRGMDILDANREASIYASRLALLEDKTLEPAAKAFLHTLLEVSKTEQRQVALEYGRSEYE